MWETLGLIKFPALHICIFGAVKAQQFRPVITVSSRFLFVMSWNIVHVKRSFGFARKPGRMRIFS